jgi:signal peptidase II
MADRGDGRVRQVLGGRAAVPDRPLSILGLGVIALVLAVDQASKILAERELPLDVTFDIVPFLALHRVHNDGIAFSLLAGFGSAGLILMTLAITVIVLAFWQHAKDGGRLAAVGYALIVGGALGNLIDRFAHGYVVDFFLLHIGELVLFIFNLADVALTLGPVLLIIAYAWPSRAPGGEGRS